jgi:hypothetical protein
MRKVVAFDGAVALNRSSWTGECLQQDVGDWNMSSLVPEVENLERHRMSFRKRSPSKDAVPGRQDEVSYVDRV